MRGWPAQLVFRGRGSISFASGCPTRVPNPAAGIKMALDNSHSKNYVSLVMLTTILSFNHPQLTAKCVRSVLENVAPQNIILTHNGSREENIKTLMEEFPKIDHLVLNENRGYSGGANATLQYAFQKSRWLLFLTNDCQLLNSPAIPHSPGLHAPLIYRRRAGKVDSLGGLFHPLRGRLEHIREIERAQKYLNFKKRRWFRQFYVPGTAFYLDASTYSLLGGFDESLHTYWEDVDLSARAHKLDVHVGITPETKILHQVGKTCHKDPYYTQILFWRNRQIISQRYTPQWLHKMQKFVYLRPRTMNKSLTKKV